MARCCRSSRPAPPAHSESIPRRHWSPPCNPSLPGGTKDLTAQVPSAASTQAGKPAGVPNLNRSRALRIPMLVLALAWALLLCHTGAAVAQKVYKSVDAEGVVSYSSTPPMDAPSDQVETVRLDPPPPEADRAAAQQRYLTPRTGSGRSGSASASQPAEQDGTASKKAGGSATSSNKQTQATPSGSRTSRPAGGGYVPERGRVSSQLPSARTSR